MIDFRYIENGQLTNHAGVIRMRCPRCHQIARMEEIDAELEASFAFHGYTQPMVIGVRYCPDENCRQVVVVLYEFTNQGPQVIHTEPAEALDLDSTDLPDGVLSALTEASQCFGAGCYRASAIMIRRTLEEVCDEQNTTGDNLKERLNKLTSQVVVPVDLLDALHDLRLLGNDGAHLELKHFDQVDREEVEIAFDLTKEFLKSLYQYGALRERLAKRKKQNSPAT